MAEAIYVLRSRGYFFRPDYRGYTSSIHEAGRYTLEQCEQYTRNREGVTYDTASQWEETAFNVQPVTADAVQYYREKTGAGMVEAKKVLNTEKKRRALSELVKHGSLEEKVDFLLARFAETLPPAIETPPAAFEALELF